MDFHRANMSMRLLRHPSCTKRTNNCQIHYTKQATDLKRDIPPFIVNLSHCHCDDCTLFQNAYTLATIATSFTQRNFAANFFDSTV